MKTRCHSHLLLSMLLVAASLAFATASAFAQSPQRAPWSKWSGPRLRLDPSAPITSPRDTEAQPDSPMRLEGTWELNEAFSPGGLDPALFTFSAGPDADHGTVVMSDSFIFTGNPSCIPAQGAWTRVGDRSFVGKHKCFAFDDNNGFAPDGFVIWRYAVAISADGNSLFGRAVLDFYDANGNYLFSGPCALQGTRMVAEPPPH